MDDIGVGVYNHRLPFQSTYLVRQATLYQTAELT